ncbi:MAG TPA: PRC-barrel domain-containing protein, partial [Burkholderiales bacterium]|nr:PRC-barrel domain-containing protein [Burkholderiales bacterium]
VRDLIVDAQGHVSRVVVGVSGVLGIGERYLGIPWNEVAIGPELAFVRVPVREDNLPEFSLFTGIEDDVALRKGSWRVNELIGDFAVLDDGTRYGLVNDVIFDERGTAQGVVVDRIRGPWGRAGWYGYPYAGHPGAPAYRLPHDMLEARMAAPFSYIELGRRSPYADERGHLAVQERAAEERFIQQRHAGAPAPAAWLDVEGLYRGGISADQMLRTRVLDVNDEPIGEVRDLILDPRGSVRRVVIGVSGLLRVGERYLGIPWNEVTIGPDMQFVRVPVREDNLPEFSLFTGVEDDVAFREGDWRLQRLLGSYARLEDLPRFGLVADVILDERGAAQAVIVDRGAGWWGAAGWHAFPYTEFDPAAPTYRLPYRADQIGALPRFDYVELGRLSRFAGGGVTERSAVLSPNR